MPRTEIPLQALDKNTQIDELTWTASDEANDHFYDNSSGRVLLLWRNDNAAAWTIDVDSVTDGEGRLGDLAISADGNGGGASTVGIAPPLGPGVWNQRGAGDLGQVFINVTVDTDHSFAAVQLGVGV